jgi:hypothetical protein
MRRFLILALATGMLSLLFLPSRTLAQQTAKAGGSATQTEAVKLPASEIERIIRAFTAKESEFRSALNNYAFKREAVLQSIGMGGQIIGEYHRVSSYTFDDAGNRFEKISFFPMPTMANVTAEDLEDLGGVNQFALEAAKIDRYNFTYMGKERIDELNLYVFDVAPKVMPSVKSKERLFLGRIWVDDQDLQIVKTRGKGVPETKENKFPNFETYRQQIDGKYWFPVLAFTDEELIFDDGPPLHIRARVRYSDYKLARSDVKIIEGDIIDETEQKPAQKPAQKPEQKPAPKPTPSKP